MRSEGGGWEVSGVQVQVCPLLGCVTGGWGWDSLSGAASWTPPLSSPGGRVLPSLIVFRAPWEWDCWEVPSLPTHQGPHTCWEDAPTVKQQEGALCVCVFVVVCVRVYARAGVWSGVEG